MPIDLKTQIWIYEDPTLSLTIEDVNRLSNSYETHSNFGGKTAFGLSDSAFWIGITMESPQECVHNWILDFSWPLLDFIDFFQYENGQWTQVSTGALKSYSSRDKDHHHFLFKISDLSKGHRPYFFRIITTDAALFPMTLWPQEIFEKYSSIELIAQGLYLGMLGGLILYNTLLYVSLRDKAYLYYVIYLAVMSFFFLGYTGISRRFIWPELETWNKLSTPMFGLAGTAAFLTFVNNILDIKSDSPKTSLILTTYSVFTLGVIVVSPFGNYSNMVLIATVLFVVGYIIAAWVIAVSIKHGSRVAYYVGAANFIMVTGTTWVFTILWGWIDKVWAWQMYVMPFGVVIEGLFLSLALADRIRLLQQERFEAQQSLLDAQHRFSHKLIGAQDNERRRVASELHDGVGQNLLVINNRLRRIIRDRVPNLFGNKLDDITNIVQDTINEVRGLSHRLHPHQLDRLGFTVATKTLAKETLSDEGVIVNVQIEGMDNALSKEQSLHLYRIIQEAVKNISHHSRADLVEIQCKIKSNNIELDISDNGSGIHQQWVRQKDFSKAFGLSSIQQRVYFLKGTFNIQNRESGGIELNIRVPLSGNHNNG